MDNTHDELMHLSNLIGLVYEGATDLTRWTNDILPAISEYLQVPECILFTNLHTPQNGGYFFIHGMTQDHVDLYMNKYHSYDLWTSTIIANNLLLEGNVLLGEDVVPREQLLNSVFYKECLSRDKNMAQLMSCVVFGSNTSNAMPTVCSFFRGLHHADFNETDILRLRLIMPHLSRSLGVLQRLQSAELAVATSQAALDRLPSAILLLDHHGNVSFANRTAQKLLHDNDGLRLLKLTHSNKLGKLVAENVAANKLLKDAISATLNRDPYATPHFSNCVLVPRTSNCSNYSLQFSSLGDHIEFGTGIGAYSTIIFIADDTQPLRLDPTLLQGAYGLTPAEARVAITLLESASAKDVADKLGTSLHTVRTQIKQIYAKLGVDTRARFVKILLGLAKYH